MKTWPKRTEERGNKNKIGRTHAAQEHLSQPYHATRPRGRARPGREMRPGREGAALQANWRIILWDVAFSEASQVREMRWCQEEAALFNLPDAITIIEGCPSSFLSFQYFL